MKLTVTGDDGAELYSYDTAQSACMFPARHEVMPTAQFLHEAMGFLIGVRHSSIPSVRVSVLDAPVPTFHIDPFDDEPPKPKGPDLRVVK